MEKAQDRKQADLIAAAYREKTDRLSAIIRPLPDPRYTVDVNLIDLEAQLSGYAKDWGLNLEPDFQRGHVWTDAQRRAYVEGLLRGTVGPSLRLIQFNAPHWEEDAHGGDLPNELQIVDGLQRLTTIRLFLAGRVKPFGMRVEEFDGSSYGVRSRNLGLKFAVHCFTRRRDLLSYYLEMNSGGTPHSAEEINRVKAMLAAVEPVMGGSVREQLQAAPASALVQDSIGVSSSSCRSGSGPTR